LLDFSHLALDEYIQTTKNALKIEEIRWHTTCHDTQKDKFLSNRVYR